MNGEARLGPRDDDQLDFLRAASLRYAPDVRLLQADAAARVRRAREVAARAHEVIDKSAARLDEWQRWVYAGSSSERSVRADASSTGSAAADVVSSP